MEGLLVTPQWPFWAIAKGPCTPSKAWGQYSNTRLLWWCHLSFLVPSTTSKQIRWLIMMLLRHCLSCCRIKDSSPARWPLGCSCGPRFHQRRSPDICPLLWGNWKPRSQVQQSRRLSQLRGRRWTESSQDLEPTCSWATHVLARKTKVVGRTYSFGILEAYREWPLMAQSFRSSSGSLQPHPLVQACGP